MCIRDSRQQNVNIITTVPVRLVRSAWKVETPAHVGRQNVQHLIAAADKKNKRASHSTMETPGERSPGVSIVPLIAHCYAFIVDA